LAADWRFVHLGIVVKDLDAAVKSSVMIGAKLMGERIEAAPPESADRVLMQFVKLGDTELEFFQPVYGRNMISEFLEKHGEGVHHLAYEVGSFEAEISRLRQSGINSILVMKGKNGRSFCFFDSGNLGGMVIELMQHVEETQG